MKRIFSLFFFLSFILLQTSCLNESKKQPDLSKAVILVSPSVPAPMNSTAPIVLSEEVAKGTSLQLETGDNWDSKTIIALALSTDKDLLGQPLPASEKSDGPEFKKEGFRLKYSEENGKRILWIIGADARGV